MPANGRWDLIRRLKLKVLRETHNSSRRAATDLRLIDRAATGTGVDCCYVTIKYTLVDVSILRLGH